MSTEAAIQTLRDAAEDLDKPALAALALTAQHVVDSDRHSVVYPLRWESDEGHEEVHIAWTSIEAHKDGQLDHSIGVARLDGDSRGEHYYSTAIHKGSHGMILASHLSTVRVAEVLHGEAEGE